jgi:glycosyltransferase involved in cell wall biosynthesis
MSDKICVSVIVPFFNAEKHIKRCIYNLQNQTFKKSFEIIMVNDGSTDRSLKIINKLNYRRIKLYNLKKNYGPANARNIGIKKARGKYIYFLDVDDQIDKESLDILFNYTKDGKFDLVFSDRKWIEHKKNIRLNKFAYKKNLTFNEKKIKKVMESRFFNPLDNVGFYNLTGRLIKSIIIKKNKISFEKKLRYLEDEAFTWDVLGHIKNAVYVKKQLYSYHINPNISTTLSSNLNKNYPLSNFKLVKEHITKSLKNKKFIRKNIDKISSQGFIYLIISAIISYSRSILLKKVSAHFGNLRLITFLKTILNDEDINREIKK